MMRCDDQSYGPLLLNHVHRNSSLVLFPPERTAFCETGFPSCGLTENCGAADAQHNSLSVTEHSGDFVATWAFNIHKIRVGTLDETFLLMSPFFILWGRV